MRVFFKLGLIVIVAVSIILTSTYTSYATPQDEAIVSITFDDGLSSTYTKALPILNSYNIQATAYITTNFIGSSGHMNWKQVKALQNKYGWEIGSHSVSHPELPLLDRKSMKKELRNSKIRLERRGLHPDSFAFPYGAYDNRVLVEMRKYYSSGRGFWDRDTLNQFPYRKTVLTVQSAEEGQNVDQIKAYIDQAITNKEWLILVLHDVTEEPDPNDPYSTTTKMLDETLKYIKQKRVRTSTVSKVIDFPDSQAIFQEGFENGFKEVGWKSDNYRKVKINHRNNGSYPNPKSSIKIIGNHRKTHAFSPKIKVSYTNTYVLTAFVNNDNLTQGELGFYIDEYDRKSNWISGKWIGYIPNRYVTDFSKVYKPSSPNVETASIQIYLTNPSKGKTFIDNIDLYKL